MFDEHSMPQLIEGKTIELVFDEDEVRLLRWLFDEGLEAVGLLGDAGLAQEMGALAPRVWNLRAGIDIVLDPFEVTLLARAISLGKIANRHLLMRNSSPPADITALRLVQEKMRTRRSVI